MTAMNRQVRLAAYAVGPPKASDFTRVEEPVPRPERGQMLCRTIYLSLDPYMRGRMNPGPSYAKGVGLGEVMVGGTVSQVVESNLPGFHAGEIVLTANGWQDYALSDGDGVRKLDPAAAPISTAVGVLGMPGFTAYVGLLDHGKPKAGETVVVSAASGAVGGGRRADREDRGLPRGRHRRHAREVRLRDGRSRLRRLRQPPRRRPAGRPARGVSGRHRRLLRERRREGVRGGAAVAERLRAGYRSAGASPTTT